MRQRLKDLTTDLMMIPGLSGHEDRVRRHLTGLMETEGLATATDTLGNLMVTIEGDSTRPSVMLYAHMDQLGLIVRRIGEDGFIWLERVGGVPEKTLAARPVLMCTGEGRDVPGIIATKSHHTTPPDEKYTVLKATEVYVDAGFSSADAVRAAGIDIGTPVIYEPRVMELAGGQIAGSAVDDRAGCAVLVEVARALKDIASHPTVHIVFAVQEEFNLRGALVAARALKPDIAIQLDLTPATDTPDLATHGEISLGGGPVMSLYAFHGRGTIAGTLPHPALVRHVEATAERLDMPLQRVAATGLLTDSSFVQFVETGIACIDLAFPARATHSAYEVCDPADLEALTRLVIGAVEGIGPGFSLDRDGATR